MTNRTVGSKDGRLGVSVAPEAAEKLVKVQAYLTDKLGVKMSMSQVVEYLVNEYAKEKSNEQS